MVQSRNDNRQSGRETGVRGQQRTVGQAGMAESSLIDSMSMADMYPKLEAFDDAAFQFPSESVSPPVEDSDRGAVDRPLEWPTLFGEPDLDREFSYPGMEAMQDTSAFGDSFSGPSADAGPMFRDMDDGIDSGGMEFHQSLSQIMDEGEMASRTTISEQALTDHHYHGPLEGLRYAD